MYSCLTSRGLSCLTLNCDPPMNIKLMIYRIFSNSTQLNKIKLFSIYMYFYCNLSTLFIIKANCNPPMNMVIYSIFFSSTQLNKELVMLLSICIFLQKLIYFVYHKPTTYSAEVFHFCVGLNVIGPTREIFNCSINGFI